MRCDKRDRSRDRLGELGGELGQSRMVCGVGLRRFWLPSVNMSRKVVFVNMSKDVFIDSKNSRQWLLTSSPS